MNGKSFDLEWIREGHRNYPLISRAPSYSALHLLADHASKVAAMENSELNVPSSTRRDRVTSVIENTSESGLNIVTEDPTKPPISLTTPAIFGISKKDLKRNIDLVTMQHTQNKKKHYHLKPPPPPPNVKIQHLYQTLNSKRSRKSFTKKSSKAKTTKQSPNRQHLQFPYQTQHNLDDKFPDELQKHLTSQSSQLMPPPMSPMKINPYSQSQSMLPTNNKNLLKINHVQQQQNLEPQAHYIPNNRLNKNEIHPEQHLHAYQSSSTRPRSGRSKSISASSKSNVGNYLHTANNTGALSIMRNNSVDHIPDPQIIFNSSSSSSSFLSKSEPSHLHHHVEIAVPIESNDIDLSSQSAITSPLQLLSTAASCTPKLKINTSQQQSSSNSNNNANINSNSQPYSQLPLSLPTSTTTSPLSTASSLINQQKSIQNRAIKIVPATTKIVPKPPQSPQHQQQQQTILSTTSTPSKFKIQKFHLVMNKNQDGTNNTKSTSTATTTTPRVIVQTIDRNQIVQQKENSEKIPENNQRITEHTPIDFMPVQAQSISFPKVIFPAPKQIKLKLSPGSIVNSKIFKNFKGPLPANLKIQRNINTKGFTVLNTSQIVQFQSIPASSTPSSSSSSSQVVNSSNIMTKAIPSNESTKTDWEQELDEANRNKAAEFSVEKDKIGDINGSETVCKKARLEENIVDESEQSIIIEESAEDGAMINEEETSSTIIYEGEILLSAI